MTGRRILRLCTSTGLGLIWVALLIKPLQAVFSGLSSPAIIYRTNDVILAGQAATLQGGTVVVASTNPRHLARFVPAHHWTKIG